jgi:small subunit ribosomal protein S17e
MIKRAARNIIEKYYQQLTLDFDTNKKVVVEVANLPSKRVRNKVAGFITHLMKRLERGTVKGISLKLQEEERERRMDFVPERSALDLPTIEVDADTRDMLRSLDFPEIKGVVLQSNNFRRDNRRQGRDNRAGRREGARAAASVAAPRV